MRRRNSASFATPTYATARDTSSVSWGYFVLTVVCACVLAAGFFLAARQHFNTMDFGFKNGKLRKQVEELQTERRRLLLAREVSLSPAEIKRAAKNLGFRDRGEVAMVTAGAGAQASVARVSAKAASTSATPIAAVQLKAEKMSDSAPARKTSDLAVVKRTVLQSVRKDGDEGKLVAAMR